MFFFTLVDFLITALFFGLVLYAVATPASLEANSAQEDAVSNAAALAAATGVSDLTELTDRLTRLGPITDVEAVVELAREVGGPETIRRVHRLVEGHGGFDSVATALAKLRREGYGIPPCRYTRSANGQKIPDLIATVRATDATIVFESRSVAFDSILGSLGLSFHEVHTLSLGDFKRSFQPIVRQHPECRFWIRFIEHTRYVDARDSAATAFRLDRVRR